MPIIRTDARGTSSAHIVNEAPDLFLWDGFLLLVQQLNEVIPINSLHHSMPPISDRHTEARFVCENNITPFLEGPASSLPNPSEAMGAVVILQDRAFEGSPTVRCPISQEEANCVAAHGTPGCAHDRRAGMFWMQGKIGSGSGESG